LAGAGGLAQIGNLGVINFAAAISGSKGRTGAQFSVGAQRIGRVFSIGGAATVAGQDYRDLASMNGDGIQRKQLSAFLSLYSKRFGSMGAAYGGMDQDPSPNPLKMSVASIQHSKVGSGSYSLQFRHFSVFASGFKDFAAASGGGGLQAGLIIPLGRRSSMNISATSDGNTQVQAQMSAAMVGEWGYDAYVSAGNVNHQFGQAQYKSSYGLLTAGVDQNAGVATMRLETQGAVSLVDHGVFPSNEIYDSFAVVDTSPMPRVHVYQENRDVGVTGSRGRLLVPDMRSFDLNHISIEPSDIPPDVKLGYAARTMRPQDRSGVIVKFPIKVSNSALLRIVGEDGKPIPLGSTAALRASGTVAPVGYDGNAYLEGLGSHNEVTIERENGSLCTLSFEYDPRPGEIPTIGPLTCKEKTP
jgi:outer membrane usher protein